MPLRGYTFILWKEKHILFKEPDQNILRNLRNSPNSWKQLFQRFEISTSDSCHIWLLDRFY